MIHSQPPRLSHRFLRLALSLACCGLCMAAGVRHVGSNGEAGGSQAVVVTGSALAHTAQFLPVDSNGKLVDKADASAQIAQVLKNVDIALREAGSALDKAVKLNISVRGPEVTAAVKSAVAANFPGATRPAVSLVAGAFPDPRVLVAADAIAPTPRDPSAIILLRSSALAGAPGANHVAILPKGPRVYISGRAAREGNVAQATWATMEQIKATLDFLGLGLADVVHVKSFVQPIAETAKSEEQIVVFFGNKAPPMTFVEWTSQNPIEIEVIARTGAPAGSSAKGIEHLTPPGDRASPVFSRIARLYHPSTIYISGLYGREGGSSSEQIHDIFASLMGILRRTGSNLDHLAKATYYPADSDPSTKLNEIRPEYYDPKSPPAASKALVAGTGIKGRSITLDIIAVPVK